VILLKKKKLSCQCLNFSLAVISDFLPHTNDLATFAAVKESAIHFATEIWELRPEQ
jgi:hypothetical protein